MTPGAPERDLHLGVWRKGDTESGLKDTKKEKARGEQDPGGQGVPVQGAVSPGKMQDCPMERVQGPERMGGTMP